MRLRQQHQDDGRYHFIGSCSGAVSHLNPVSPRRGQFYYLDRCFYYVLYYAPLMPYSLLQLTTFLTPTYCTTNKQIMQLNYYLDVDHTSQDLHFFSFQFKLQKLLLNKWIYDVCQYINKLQIFLARSICKLNFWDLIFVRSIRK